MIKHALIPICVFIALTQAKALDLSNAVVVSPPGLSDPENKAVQMLVEEVEKRTGIRWPRTDAWPTDKVPVIGAGLRSGIPAFAGAYANGLQSLPKLNGAEGYRLWSDKGDGAPGVFVVGNDSRGLLFGIGRLLRELHMEHGQVNIEDRLDIATAPAYPLRGHQLGYRPKCNSYDAWDLPVWEQYFRDLAVFGCNAIELIPPRSDDDANSPHFPRPPMEMMEGMSRLADDYGLDVWVWYPAMDKDYASSGTVKSALREWGNVFSRLKRIDAVFVPGGDPGHTQPKVLLALLGKQTENLHRYHPKAQMWVSPQGFTQAWLDEFVAILQQQQPAWLSGVVHGPQVRISLARLRELVPARYPIRQYPDITHTRQCQYPVPDWDVAYAVTEGRECINPRPEGEALIFRKTQPGTIGFISYSEGCNDDVNKFIWSGLGWDSGARPLDILRQYCRYFIGERYTDNLARGFMDLEQNWQGPLLTHDGVEQTLARFQAMEKTASPEDLKNWRFQQALFRAYYDVYTRRRLVYENNLETQAMERLRKAPATGTHSAIADARKTLGRALSEDAAPEWRARIFQLGNALFRSIGMQLSVELYQAIGVDRGASLDTLNFPLNNRLWLEQRFARIDRMRSESSRLKGLQEILNWTDPGPGGFYDDFGNSTQQPHLLPGIGLREDPGCYTSARGDFEEEPRKQKPGVLPGTNRRISWQDHAEPLYDTPLEAAYTGLDPNARYRVRVVYAGDSYKKQIRLMANDSIQIHPYLARPKPVAPLEFALPQSATREGKLKLSWFGKPGLGGNGRTCQISEVWLLKEPPLPAR